MKSFLTTNVDGSPDLDTLIKDAIDGNTEQLEHALEQFYASVRVTDKSTGESLLPKKGTMDCYRSHLKVMSSIFVLRSSCF